MSSFISTLADATGLSTTVSQDVTSAERYTVIAFVVIALELALVVFLLAGISRKLS